MMFWFTNGPNVDMDILKALYAVCAEVYKCLEVTE